jgi:hypothetical protein
MYDQLGKKIPMRDHISFAARSVLITALPVLMTVLFTPVVRGQDGWASMHTGGLVNGRYWNRLDNAQFKAIYVIGFSDGVNQAGKPDDKKLWFPWGMSNAEIVKSLDRFYDTPENLRIAVTNALIVCSARLRGMSEEDVQKMVLLMRQGSVDKPTTSKNEKR